MLLYLIIIFFSFLFPIGILEYPGSSFDYAIFSIIFFAIAISGFYRPIGFGYLFFSLMLWLGFWLKITLHLVLKYPYVEPVGFFRENPTEWNTVLHIASIGGAGVLVGRLLYETIPNTSTMFFFPGRFTPPPWYSEIRRWVWTSLVLSCISLSFLNAFWGIEQIGLVPRTILPWPFNAVISWLITNGLAFGVITLLWWDITIGNNIDYVIYFLLIEAFASTVSILSRATYVFHTLPIFLALFINRKLVRGLSRTNIIMLSMTFTALFLISYPLVNEIRGYYYSETPPATNAQEEIKGLLTATKTQEEIKGLLKFSVDRWIGVEGVMAVSAYPEIGPHLFSLGLLEIRKTGSNTLYQEICRSNYRFMNLKKFQFGSLPGPIGFLFYSGSLLVVGIGMIILVLIILGSESLVFKLTGNPLLCALWGGVMASSVSQMGLAPRGYLIYLFELSSEVVVIWFIQSEWFYMLLQRLKIFPSTKDIFP